MTPAAASGRRIVRRSRSEIGLALGVGAALVVLLALGTWQVRRLAWKEALIATVTERLSEPVLPLPVTADWSQLEFRRVAVRGSYRHEAALAFGLSARQQQIGAHVLTPFVLDDGQALLVDRGWLPEPLLPPADPVGLRPEGPRALEGVLRWREVDERNPFTPADDPERRRVYGYDGPLLERLTGQALLPVVIQLQAPDTASDLPRPDAAVVDYRNAHLGYAITWYGLAAALVVVYVVFSRRQRGG